MCGIAGLARQHSLAPDDVAAVTRMTEAQLHRGPDGCGLYQAADVAFGHRRLSIIDVSDAGKQPMSNEDGSVWVTYNGELYNHLELRQELVACGHQFRSHSDTEAIVHGYEQWGIEGLLSRLRGMFALAVHDVRDARVWMARDRLGIKPLYYALLPDRTLLFASELRAVMASGLVPHDRDRDALAGFLLSGSVPAPRTTVKGVRSLMPGCYAGWKAGQFTARSYWELPSPGAAMAADAMPMSRLLQDAVARHLVSDVPLGVFLSGGVDSGAVVALASRARGEGTRLTTLTVTFDEPEFSEADATAAMARRFTTDHREVRVTRSEFVQELPRILRAMDQPTNDGVNTYFVSRAARQAGLTVVLSGLGGDEVFWGYKHYRWLNGRAAWIGRCPSGLRKALAHGGAWLGRVRGRDSWRRLGFLGAGASSRELYLLMRGFFAPEDVMALLDLDTRGLERAIAEQFAAVSDEPSRRAAGDAAGFNHLEFKRYLHDQLLRDTDVFSMAHSIEVRVPLLDHLVVERALAMSAAEKMASGVNKPVLVDAVDDPLVRRAGEAPKRGFSFPMGRWMQASAHELEEMSAGGGLFDQATVRTLWQEFRGDRLHWSRAWALAVSGAMAQ